MYYVDLNSGAVKSKAKVIDENRHRSLPSRWTEQTLSSLGIAPVEMVSPPPVQAYEETYLTGAEQDSEGKWVATYGVRVIFSEYVDDNGTVVTVEQQIAEEQEAELRRKRREMVCTPRQARLALAQTGRYGAVKSFMAGLPVDQKETADIEWEYATTFERTSGVLTTLTAAMGMTEEEVDDLFDLAVTL